MIIQIFATIWSLFLLKFEEEDEEKYQNYFILDIDLYYF